MPETTNKRYPGARPFKDNPMDRKLFFGRKAEKKKLLHLILSNNIVVLFAKSGVGKSSLLNAGVFEHMNKRDYFPVSIRLNDPSTSILDSIESHIVEFAREKKVDYIPGKKDSLWDFLKTAEFWTEDDKLMTPVLVFDQFEEIFTLGYNEDQRKDFFKQLADLGKVKRKLSQSKGDDPSKYSSDTPPKVKIVLSLREEFLAQLEEISEDIPSILRNRFRLTALSEDQAIEAIEKPAELSDENFSSRNFNYTEGAIKAVTNFLMKKDLRERMKIITRDTKWPKWPMLIFAALLIPLTWLVNYPDRYLGEMIFYVVLCLVIPSFTFTLAIRKPIAGRNTILPIVLIYTWFFILTFVSNIANSFRRYELLTIFIITTIVVLLVVWGICAFYRKGRNKVLGQSDLTSTEVDFKNKKWPRKLLTYLFIWIIGSSILSIFMDISADVAILNVLVILSYFIVLFIKFPILPKKTILPIAGAYFLIYLMLTWSILGNRYREEEFIISFLAFIFMTLLNFILVALLWWSYLRGMKSVDPQLLEILGKSKEKIEPFQLQLLCQNIEDKVLLKQGNQDSNELISITEKDFGGDEGMRRILLKFYDDQLKKVSWKIRGKVRRLCENGLISQSGRRLSIAEDDIINRFKLEKETLFALIDNRLLRAEPRLGNKYYEISHDTLVQPILTSAKKHINRDMILKWVGFAIGLLLLITGLNFYYSLVDPSTQEIYEQMDEILESKTSTLKEKIRGFRRHLDILEQREDLKWLIKSNEKNGYQRLYQYRKSFNLLQDIGYSLINLKSVRLVDAKNKEVDRYRVSPGSIFLRFSTVGRSEVKFHNLEIEWHYRSNNSNDSKLLRKFKLESVSTDTIKLPFYLSEFLCEGGSHLKIYERVPGKYSGRYLLENFNFSVELESIQYYEDILLNDSINRKYNAYLGFLYSKDRGIGSREDIRTDYREDRRRIYILEAELQDLKDRRRGSRDYAIIYHLEAELQDLYREDRRIDYLEKSLKYLNRAIEIDSNYALAYYWRGNAQRNKEKSMSDYLSAYRLDPSLWPALEKILDGSSNMISNGSFELPKVPDNHYLLTSELRREKGNTLKGPSWENEAGINFDLKSYNLGQGDAKDGDQFIELAGKSRSWIHQKIETESNTDYIVSFAFSPRPKLGLKDNIMEISWNGVVIDTVQADGRRSPNEKWQSYFYEVTATSESSSLQFRDIGDSEGRKAGTGPYLDAVFLVKKPDINKFR